MSIELPKIESNVLKATAGDKAGDIQVTLNGSADLRNERQVDLFLQAVHAEAKRRRSKEVVVDVRNVDFMNSGCLKAFVVWISEVRQLGAAGYKIRFLKNEEMSWQRRSLHSLKCFGEDVVLVQ